MRFATNDYDTDPEVLVRRLVYGRPKPIMRPRERVTQRKLNELWTALANAPGALWRSYTSPGAAAVGAHRARQLLPAGPGDAYEIKVENGTDVVIYVRGHPERGDMNPPPAWYAKYDPRVYISATEAVELLGIGREQVRRITAAAQLPKIRTTVAGTPLVLYPRDQVLALAHRPRRHRRYETPHGWIHPKPGRRAYRTRLAEREAMREAARADSAAAASA